MQAETIVCRDLNDLSRRAAKEFVRLAARCVAADGRFISALSGGGTPKSLYSLLATEEFRAQIPWAKIHFFWGDERCVPPEYPDSNYRMAFESLLSKVPVPKENTHRIEAELEPEIAAAKYEREIREFFRLTGKDLPRFDLILLGLGADGHTASLFPGNQALEETGRLVVATYVDELKTYRITLTLPVLNHAANICFLVAGENKAAVLRDVRQRSKDLPARRIAPVDGRVVWFLDEAVASLFALNATGLITPR
jgi:6-phosphogluconolactonase